MTTTEPPTLTEFLLARIAEDEAAAASVGEGRRAGMLIDPSLVRYANRVLAECDAKRRIVAVYRETVSAIEAGNARPWKGDQMQTLDEVLHFLALPYADHPDYRPEWRL